MGGAPSAAVSRAEQNVRNIIVNRMTQANQANISNVLANVQNLRVQVGGNLECDEAKFTQSIKQNAQVWNNVTQQQEAQIKNDLVNDFKNKVEAKAQAEGGSFLNPGALSVSEAITNITNEFENTIQSVNIAEIMNSVYNSQTQSIEIKGDWKGRLCQVSQDILQDIQIHNVVNQLQSAISQNSVVNRVVTDVLSEAEQTSKKSGKKKKKKTVWIIIGSILLLALIIGIVRAIMKRKKPDDASSSSTTVVVASPAAPPPASSTTTSTSTGTTGTTALQQPSS